MADREIATLFEGGSFFEGPRWHDGRWWVSDFYSHLVRAIDADGNAQEILEVEGQPSGLGWMPDGSMLSSRCATRRSCAAGPMARSTCTPRSRSSAAATSTTWWSTPTGGAWVGNFGFDLMGGGDPATANLIRVEPDGTARVAAEDLMFPNGSVITPDGGTLIVGETAAGRYTAFTIEENNELSDRRVWAQIGEPPPLGPVMEMIAALEFEPDGCALDAEGRIWAADAGAGRAALVAEGGEVVDEVRAPEGLGIFACMLGGDDGRTLLMCAAPDFFEHNRAPVREAVLLTTTVDVPHAGLP